jgi:hypothetical protein
MSVFIQTPHLSFLQLLSPRLWKYGSYANNYGSYATNYLKLMVSEGSEQRNTKYPTSVWIALY